MSKQTMQSFGSQEWDAGFAVQALLATNLIEEIGPALAKGHDFIKKSQVYMLNIDVIITILLPSSYENHTPN
jgi:squalene cyclase